jgi:hypothetical protein
MRPLIAAVALAMVVATGACWFPDKAYVQSDAPPPPDAPPGRFDCHNVPTPLKAKKPRVTIKGTVTIATMSSPLGGASVQLFASGALVQTVKTPTMPPVNPMDPGIGQFSFELATPSPTEIYLVVTDNNYLTTMFYPAEAVTDDIEIDPQMFDMGIANYVAGKWGVTLDLMHKVQFLIGAVDCQDNALGGATVSVSPQGDGVHYFVDSPGATPDPDAILTDSATGAAVATNLSPQFIMVSGTYVSPSDGSTQTMLHHSIDAGQAVGALIQTEIRP